MDTYDARLATRVTGDVRRRLKIAARLRDLTISAFLTEVLEGALPTDAQLADQVKGHATDEH
jgi:uncharacterized protein (DUF1778 family)